MVSERESGSQGKPEPVKGQIWGMRPASGYEFDVIESVSEEGAGAFEGGGFAYHESMARCRRVGIKTPAGRVILDRIVTGAVESLRKVGDERKIGPLPQYIIDELRVSLAPMVDGMPDAKVDLLTLAAPGDIEELIRCMGLDALAGERPS